MQGLPAGWYVDPAREPLELSSIFLRGWQFVCHAADLPAPGTAVRYDCGDRSAFVLRKRAGSLAAYRNACSHRGARLVDGDPGTGLAFVLDGRVRCPYHGWCYDEHGRLESIPAGQGFDVDATAEHALAELPVTEWRGLVFVCLGTPERPLEAALGDAAVDWPDASAMRRLGEPRNVAVAADWKLACEHALDTAHLHVARSTPAPRVFEPLAFAAAGPDALRATARAVDPSRAAWPARAYLRAADGVDDAHLLYLWPNLLLLAAPDALCVLQVLPLRTGQCRWRLVRYGMPDASDGQRLRRYLHERAWRRALYDDARRLERVQHGLGNFSPDHTFALDAAQPGLQWFAERCRRAEAPEGRAATRRKATTPRTRKRPAPAATTS